MRNDINISRFPGSLEAVTWRKGSQDFGITWAVPQEMREYVKPLMDKINQYFVSYCFEVRDVQQAESLLQAKEDGENTLPSSSNNREVSRFCGLEEIASILSMSPRTAQLYAQKGVIIRVNRGRYDLAKSVQNYIKELQVEQSETLQMKKLKIQEQQQKNEMGDIKKLEKLKKLVIAEDAKEMVYKSQLYARNKLLSLGTVVAPLLPLPNKEGIVRAREIIDDHVRESLEELKGLDPSRMGDHRGKQSMGAATKTKRKRVGGCKKSSKRA